MADPPAIQNFSEGPSIFKLHEDLVWRIFLFNADLNDQIATYVGQSLAAPFTTNGLTVTRRTSQVCRPWRSLILSSTAIWGRVIDLPILNRSSELWSREVLKRTGEAPLDIKGELLGTSPYPLFLLLVQHHWTRIRSLDVGIFAVGWISKEAWEFLKQPAPNMKVFSIRFHDLYPDNQGFFSETNMKLFANRASSLRELLISHITFDPRASWFANLRNLDLASPFPLRRLLEILKNTPVLEGLVLRGETIDNWQPAEQVTLPRLRTINISHRLRTCLAVLECISPASDCGITVTARDIPPDIPLLSDEVTRLRSTISRFSQAYFSAWKVTQVYLQLSVHAFRFEAGFTSDEMTLPPISAPGFNVNIDLGKSAEFPPQECLSILADITNDAFSDVSTLTIHAFTTAYGNSHFASFISALASVKELRATPSALGALVDIQVPGHPFDDGESNPVVVFPQLRTLVIDFEFVHFYISNFLSWRRRNGGTPLEVLDLTNVQIYEDDEVGEKFREYDGLTVLNGPIRSQLSAGLKAWLEMF